VNNETVSGTLSTGTLDATTLNSTTTNNSGLLTTDDIHTRDFTSTDSMTVNNLSGTQGFFTHLQTGNTLSNDTNTNTLTVNSSANINSATIDNAFTTSGPYTANGPVTLNTNTVVQNGNIYHMLGGSSPCVALGNTANNITLGMWNASNYLQFGLCDGSGNPQTAFIEMNGFNGSTLFVGGTFPSSDGASNSGNSGQAWGTVAGHNIIGPFTSFQAQAAAITPTAALSAVVGTTDPTTVAAVRQGSSDLNYGAVIVLLWEALKQLNDNFEAYVATHP